MKKIIASLIVCGFAVAMVACGAKKEETAAVDSVAVEAPAAVDTTAADTTAAADSTAAQ